MVIRETGTSAGKARPCIVVQRSSALATTTKVTVCPLTSRLKGSAGQRPFVAPSDGNRLQMPSEVEVDWIYTHSIDRIGGVIGSLDAATMDEVDRALRRWLQL